jgi:NADH/NAD ratio-sensing transcriptional regulator Rex
MQVKQLMDLTDLVRGELPKLARLTLGALIVIDVHARDVVQRLVDENIAAITEFEWVSASSCLFISSFFRIFLGGRSSRCSVGTAR